MKKRLIAIVILIAYIAILIKVMVFKDMPLIRVGHLMLNFGGTQEGAANLIPFKTILPYLLGEKGFLIALINIAGNIALLVPVGFLIPFIFPVITWRKLLVIATASGFVIEGMQAVLHVGIFDIDDVLLNGLGVLTGFWSYTILEKWMRSGKYKTIIVTSIVIIAVAGATLFAIYPKEQGRVNSERATEKNQPDHFDKEEDKISQGVDPCNGTGGTGEIISLEKNTITIKRNDGVDQIIKLTDRTKIKSSIGPVRESDLKTGNRVTVVIDDSETASVVLVCNEKNPEPVK